MKTYVKDLGLSGAVKFFGYRRDVELFYKASDVFALTSDIEGFALVGIEAMACGLPVVSTVTAGPDEYVLDGRNGFLIRERAAEAVAATILKALQADREVLRTGALATAKQFDIRSTVKKYEELFRGAA